jgi:NADH:ubiquinone oxidoreductase subunit C
MLQNNRQTLKAALEEKFGNAAFNFTEKNGAAAFFIHPSSQTAIFNFLVYEEQWKYDVLKDVNLLYEPDHPVSEYVLVYVVASKLHKEEQYVHLPVAFSNGKANSLVHLYKTAEKFEQIVAEIYGISFVSKKIKLDDFPVPQPNVVTELAGAGATIAKHNDELQLAAVPEISVEKTTSVPQKKKKEIPVVTNVIAAGTGTFSRNLVKEKAERRERRSVATGGKLLAMLPSYRLPEETKFKVLYYLTPLVMAAAIFLFIKIGNNASNENEGYQNNSASGLSQNDKPEQSSMQQTDYNVVLPASSNGNKPAVNNMVPGLSVKEKDAKQKEKDNKAKKEAAEKSNNNMMGLPLTSQTTINPLAQNNEVAPVSFIPSERENKSFVPANNTQEAGNIKSPPVTQLKIDNKNEAVIAPTLKPEFPGGTAAMTKYLRKKLQMPDEAVDNNVDGNVVVRFLVDANGGISNIELSKKIGYGCDEVVERAIQSMPKWIPGKINGNAEPMPVKLSVKFLVKGNQPNP